MPQGPNNGLDTSLGDDGLECQDMCHFTWSWQVLSTGSESVFQSKCPCVSASEGPKFETAHLAGLATVPKLRCGECPR